jgi:CDP-diacylglycerol--glycerol-3-phosphate 3-phosphatidyltransferase
MAIPNTLTILRILITPVFVALLVSESSLNRQISILIYALAALTDWYDGWAARRYHKETRFGKFLDPLADKILSTAALVAFVVLGLIDAWMVWTIAIRDVAITGLRTYGEYKALPIVTSRTAQAKTFGEFIVIYYILTLYVASSIPIVRHEFGETLRSLLDPLILFGMMLVVTISSVATGVLYLVDNRKLVFSFYAGVRSRLGIGS